MEPRNNSCGKKDGTNHSVFFSYNRDVSVKYEMSQIVTNYLLDGQLNYLSIYLYRKLILMNCEYCECVNKILSVVFTFMKG